MDNENAAHHLRRYLLRLRTLVWPYLDRAHRDQLCQLEDPRSALSLAAVPELATTWFEVACYSQRAWKPARANPTCQ